MIGIDGAVPTLLEKFHKEGIIPNISNLIDNGVFAEAYPCPPCDTPTNWSTIATGATTATHGATSFYVHLPGEPLDLGLKHRGRSQLSHLCKAEYFWDVAERCGVASLVINYPVGWPSSMNRGAMVLYSWPMPESLPRALAPPMRHFFSSKAKDPQHRITTAKACPPTLTSHRPPLEITISIKEGSLIESSDVKAFLLDQKGVGYDSLALPVGDKVYVIEEGSWSEWIRKVFRTRYGELEGLFRVKLVKVARDGSEVELYRSEVLNTKGWTQPEHLAQELIAKSLIHIEPHEEEVPYIIFGREAAYVEDFIREAKSLVKIISYMKRRMRWRVCFLHYHILDGINHRFAAAYEGVAGSTSEDKERAHEAMRRAYQIIDELVGELIKHCASEDTIIVLVSDHGAVPAWKVVNIVSAFVREGLLSYRWDNSMKKYVVDWKHTLAFPYYEPPYVWVNLKGREPHGIVEPKDYEEVRDRIIETLYDIRDPETKQRVVQLAIRREDAALLGLGGERDGDVIYFLRPPYEIFDGRLDQLDTSVVPPDIFASSEVHRAERAFCAHVYYLPTVSSREFTVKSVLIMRGPGIRKGVKLKKTINLIDIAPTLAHLMGMPPPRNSEGRMIYEALR